MGFGDRLKSGKLRERLNLKGITENGVIINFAKTRIEEAENEFKKIKDQGIISYCATEQRLRKALLIEFFDYLRPVVGTKYEHMIQPSK